MRRQHFFADGAHLGTREIDPLLRFPGEAPSLATHYAFFCPRCGEIWGRVHFEYEAQTRIVSRPCLRHGDGRLSASSRYHCLPLEFDESWPSAAIRHEFLAELAYRETLYRS